MTEENNCGLCDAMNEEYRFISRNEHAIAIIIRDPQLEYHSLVLPIKHRIDFADLSYEESYSLHNLVKDLTIKMDQKLGCSSIAVLNGKKFRTQEHIHYQVLPVHVGLRTIISGHLDIPESYTATQNDLKQMAQQLLVQK